jgi:hypothetical protein
VISPILCYLCAFGEEAQSGISRMSQPAEGTRLLISLLLLNMLDKHQEKHHEIEYFFATTIG